jgi:hypothetical protein
MPPDPNYFLSAFVLSSTWIYFQLIVSPFWSIGLALSFIRLQPVLQVVFLSAGLLPSFGCDLVIYEKVSG